MTRLFTRVLLGCATMAAAAYAQGPTVVGDAYLQSGTNSAQAFGALANVLVGPGTGATQNNGLIQFDLTALGAVPPSAVQKAVLWVYVNRVTAAGAIDVYDVTTSWSEGSVTWNTAPVTGGILGSVPVTSPNQWVGVDVTPEVQAWLGTPSLNHGVELKATTAPSTSVNIDAKESTTTSHPAQLQIVLSGPAGPTGAAGPAGATGPAGLAGPAGPTGATGVAGPAGASGATGPAGLAGPAGPTGATGVAGPAGASGATGPAGLAGPAGPTGATGVAGPAGPAGATGSTGPTGFTGAAGPAGPTGATGPAGSNGTGASATGIPLGVSGHNGAAAWNQPGGSGQQIGLNAIATAVAPAACKPSMTIYSYSGAVTTWNLLSVTPSTASTTWAAGGTLLSCSTASSGGSTCTATAASTVSAGTIMTLTSGAGVAPGGGGFLAAFSCQ